MSFVLLFQTFGISASDIAQLDEFIEHAKFHSEQYGDNVFVFISKHYGELKADHDKEHQEEKEEHEQLPFQQHSQVSSAMVFVLNTNQEFRTSEVSDLKVHTFIYKEPSSSLHSEGLFQPPRNS